MYVILNTSALSALTLINGFVLLEKVFEKVAVPKGVIDEFSTKFSAPPKWIEVLHLDAKQLDRANKLGLGKGENEAIILAQDLNALLVIEDKKARKLCDQLKVNKTGTFGIIRIAYQSCFIERPELNKLVNLLKTDLYYSDNLLDIIRAAQKPGNNP